MELFAGWFQSCLLLLDVWPSMIACTEFIYSIAWLDFGLKLHTFAFYWHSFSIFINLHQYQSIFIFLQEKCCQENKRYLFFTWEHHETKPCYWWIFLKFCHWVKLRCLNVLAAKTKNLDGFGWSGRNAIKMYRNYKKMKKNNINTQKLYTYIFQRSTIDAKYSLKWKHSGSYYFFFLWRLNTESFWPISCI